MSRSFYDDENQDERKFFLKYKNGGIHFVGQCDPDDECFEKRKKIRCDDDLWDFFEKCSCRPCHDWCRCPPWFWSMPQNGEKKECECKEDCKKRKESGELEAYAYVFSLTATTVVVGPNADVIFTNNGPMEGITHTPNTPQLFIRKSGVYEIYYGVNTTTGAGGPISLAVNGAVNPTTTIPLGASPGETSGKVLLNLRAGDFLTLRNGSANQNITLAAAPAIGAQLTLERIDEIDKKSWD